MTASFDSAAPHRSLAFATQVLPSVLYAAALFYGGLIRLAALPQVGFVSTDKLLHALAFGGLALLLARTVHFFQPLPSLGKKLLWGALGSSVVGALLELCQAFTRYRSADVWDWFADTVGALLAVLLLAPLLRRASRRAPRGAHG